METPKLVLLVSVLGFGKSKGYKENGIVIPTAIETRPNAINMNQTAPEIYVALVLSTPLELIHFAKSNISSITIKSPIRTKPISMLCSLPFSLSLRFLFVPIIVLSLMTVNLTRVFNKLTVSYERKPL